MSLYDPILELDIPKLEDDPKYKAGQQSMQSKIEQLEKEKQQVQNRFNFLLDKNICNESEHATLKLKFMEITRLVQSLRNEFDLNSDCPQVERQIELLEKTLRGES